MQVLDPKKQTLLRQLKGHQRPVHTTHFASDKMHVLSGSDDATVRWWDITAGEQLFRLNGHSDYIRSSACSPASPDTWATGEAPSLLLTRCTWSNSVAALHQGWVHRTYLVSQALSDH